MKDQLVMQNNTATDHNRLNHVIYWLPMGAVVAIGAMTLSILLSMCNYGFDFTDEGNYLNWINSPFPVRDRQFGYIYQPLWHLLGKDVALLRQANVMITFCLAFLFSWLLLGLNREGYKFQIQVAAQRIGLAFALATISLVVFGGLLTPSYNSLAYQALLIAASGLILVDRMYSISSMLGWILLGIGGCLAFMGKPTTALGLAFLSLLYVLATKRARLSLVILSAGSSFLLLFLFVLLVDGSPVVFIERTRLAVGDISAFGTGHVNFLRYDSLDYSGDSFSAKITWTFIVYSALGVMLSSWISAPYSVNARSPRVWLPAIVWAALFSLAITGSLIFGFDLAPWRSSGDLRLIPMLGVAFGTILACVLTLKYSEYEKNYYRVFAQIIVFLLMPYAFAMGTQSNYWHHMQYGGFFWISGGIVALSCIQNKHIWGLSCCVIIAISQILTVNSIILAAENPYRQQQIFRKNNHKIVNLTPAGSPVRISKDFSSYIATLRIEAEKNGLVLGTPLIDLTGHYPGAVFILGAQPVGAGWLCGGYPGSKAMVERYLDRVPMDTLQKSWVLTEPGGPRPLPDSILARYGFSLEEGYGLVAVLTTPEESESRGVAQFLYKPGVPDSYRMQILSERHFPVSFPIMPIQSENLIEKTGNAHGWINVGFRGEIQVTGVEGWPGVMRLIAGKEKGTDGNHVLLLKPVVSGDKGLEIISGAQFVKFNCEFRTKGSQHPDGGVRLRLDALTPSGWNYAYGDRWVEVGEEWEDYSVMVSLKELFEGITPIFEWHPGAEGDVLEMRKPLLRWIKHVETPKKGILQSTTSSY